MRTTMQRRIVQSEIKIVAFHTLENTVEAEPLESIIVVGSVSERKADKLAQDQYADLHPDSRIVATSVITQEKLYEMELNDFVAYATEVVEN